jgi:hypothetical protein
MQKLACGVLMALLLFAPAASTAGELRLSIANGRVTLVAQDVTVKQILDEWARVGQTKIVNADKIAGPPVTLELQDVPEGRALETLLRSASGYVAKPRTGADGTSTYAAILIMPFSKAPAVSAAPQPFTRPQPQVMPNVIVDDEAEPNPVMPPGAAGTQQFPGAPVPQPGQPPPVLTSPRPGMLPQPPPVVPGNPYQPNPQVPQPNPQVPQPNPQVPVRPPGTPGGPGGQ